MTGIALIPPGAQAAAVSIRKEHMTRIEHPSVDVLYFIAIAPQKVGGIEIFARELALALGHRGLSCCFCFAAPASDLVRAYFDSSGALLIHEREQGGFSVPSILGLWRILRRLKPGKVVYSFGSILRPLPWLCRLSSVDSVYYNDHASRVLSDSQGSTLKKRLARFFTMPVSSVIAVSHFVAENSRKERLHGAPVTVIPNGVNTGRREAQRNRKEFLAMYGIPEERKVVGHLSWLVPEKGVDRFIRAAARVLRDRNDVHFLIGGEGPSRKAYEELARDLDIQSRLSFIGPLASPMASGFYQALDLFCLISQWQEACGLVLLEAMAHGVPVVASRVGGIPEYVRDGVDGLLVGSDDEACSNAILALLENDAARRNMGKSARMRIEQEFDVRRMANRYAALIAGGDSGL